MLQGRSGDVARAPKEGGGGEGKSEKNRSEARGRDGRKKEIFD